METMTMVRSILEEILRRVDKRTHYNHRRLKKSPPAPLQGWVNLKEIIPEFRISRDLYHKLIFKETLIISNLSGDSTEPVPVGGLCLDVQPAKGNPFKIGPQVQRAEFQRNKLLVHLSSEFDCDGLEAGSRITSWLDRNLQTLEERRREFIQDGEDWNEQTIYTSSQSLCYFSRHNHQTEQLYDPQKAKNLILEGASFILMRYLAITLYMGTFEVTTTYINGDLCRNIYECQGPSSGVVNDTKLDVCKILRTIIEECGIIHNSVTVLTLQGQILKHEWDECDYVIHVNPLARLQNRQPMGNEVLLKEKAWMRDFELFSRYLDRKTVCKKEIEAYLHDHPEIKEMTADYFQQVLLMKPQDVVDFTARYFLSYAPDFLPRTEYFENPLKETSQDEADFWKYL